MANFSSTKKASKPPSSTANSVWLSACDSKASGNACNKEVASMMPTDRLTMRSTILDSSANEKIAAAVILKTPAIVVARMIETSVELIFSPGRQRLNATWLQIKTQLPKLRNFTYCGTEFKSRLGEPCDELLCPPAD